MRPYRAIEYRQGGGWLRVPRLARVVSRLALIHLLVFVLLEFLSERDALIVWSLLGAKSLGASQLQIEGAEFLQYVEFFSYAFLHADWSHLLSNILFLVIFGQLLAIRFGADNENEPFYRFWGGLLFVFFYLSAASFCAFCFIVIHASEPRILIGASGAVSALIGASISVGVRRFQPYGIFEGRPMSPFEPKMLIVSGIYIGANVLQGIQQSQMVGDMQMGRVSWEVHIAGFMYGVFVLPLFDRLVFWRR